MAFPLFNIRFILLISASFIAIFSSIAIYFCLPILISHVIRIQITLSSSSGSFSEWRTNSAIDQIYLYNLTNLNDLFSESAKRPSAALRPIPKLRQIGPFTFRQNREKLNIQFDIANETVMYDQKKSWIFIPELSQVKSLEEMNSTLINHINVPLAGTTMNPEYTEFIEPLVSEHDLKLFSTHSISTLLFDGYYDILMENAKASGQIDIDRFGWMHNQNNSVTKSIRIFTGPSNTTLDKFGSIDEYQYKRQFSIWHNNNSDPRNFSEVKCNDFRFSSAGEFFPPPEYSIISHTSKYTTQQRRQAVAPMNNGDKGRKEQLLAKQSDFSSSTAMDRHLSLVEFEESIGTSGDGNLKKLDSKVGKIISLFMPDLCRTIKLYYNGSYYYKDLLVDRYIADKRLYNYNTIQESTGDFNNVYEPSNEINQDNQCFCIFNENTRSINCPPNGMMDLFACQKGSPMTISFPHFLYSGNDRSLAPYLKLFEDDLEADEKEHSFFIDLESTINVPVNVQIVLQFNVHLRNEPSMNFMREYASLFDDPNGQSNSTYKDLYLPQMWIKSTAKVDDRNLNNLKFIQKHLDLVTPITTITIFCFASILLMASAKMAYDLTYGPKSRKSLSCNEESCSSVDRNCSDCSYLDEKKQKYFVMRSLKDDGVKSQQFCGGNIKKYQSNNKGAACANNHDNPLLDEPTTSKKAGVDPESEPLRE